MDVVTTTGIKALGGVQIAVNSGIAAPIANVPADANAACTGRADITNIGGFSDAVFNVISAFLADHHQRFVAQVEAIELQGGIGNLPVNSPARSLRHEKPNTRVSAHRFTGVFRILSIDIHRL